MILSQKHMYVIDSFFTIQRRLVLLTYMCFFYGLLTVRDWCPGLAYNMNGQTSEYQDEYAHSTEHHVRHTWYCLLFVSFLIADMLLIRCSLAGIEFTFLFS